jgi:ferric-dicitrate binding protein FerR (iron transport regulator)
MTDHETHDKTLDTDEGIERLLTEALGSPGLTEDRLGRVRAVVTAEWRTATAAACVRPMRPSRPRWLLVAAAASLTAVFLAYWVARPADPGISIGAIAKLNSAGAEIHSGAFRHRSAGVGDFLRVGDRLTAAGPMLMKFAQGGTLRVAAGSSLTMTTASQLSLDRGLIYLDFPPASAAPNPMHIKTSAGVIDHLGTEFEVRCDVRDVRIRVREGRIRLVGKAVDIEAGSGTELLAAPGVPVARRSIDTYGPDWVWTSELAPEFDIEGRHLTDFLNWAGRESGRRLDFADAQARLVADRTVLHGSLRGQAPDTALSSVLATTSLAWKIQGGSIVIASSLGP